MRLAILSTVLTVFFGFSLFITIDHGYFGFLTLAAREPWALQLLLDLTIACFLCSSWMIRDARERGIAVWPFMPLVFFGGSIGVLLYLVRRELGRASAPATT